MTQEPQISKELQLQLYGLDCISQMAYWSHMNVEYCKIIGRVIPPSGLKDTIIMYRQSEENWLNKILRTLKGYKVAGVDMVTSLQQDMDSMNLIAMFDIISSLKKTQDMEGVADLVKELAELKDIEPIKTNLIALIRNEKTKQDAK